MTFSASSIQNPNLQINNSFCGLQVIQMEEGMTESDYENIYESCNRQYTINFYWKTSLLYIIVILLN